MNKKQTNFFGAVKQNGNFFFLALSGILFSVFANMLDKMNVIGTILKNLDVAGRVSDLVLAAVYGLLLTGLVVLVIVFLLNAFSKEYKKTDSVLLFANFLSVTFMIENIALKTSRMVLSIVIFAILLLLLIIRFIRVKECEEKVKAVGYKQALVTRKSFIGFVLVGAALGITLGVLLSKVNLSALLGSWLPLWAETSKYFKIGLVAGVAVALLVGFNLYTLLNSKKVKFGFADLILVSLTVATFFAGTYFTAGKTAYIWQFCGWLAILFGLVVSLYNRSVNVVLPEEKELGKVALYGYRLSEKVSLFTVSVIGLVLCYALYKIDVVNLAGAFAPENVSSTVVTLLLLVLIVFGALVSLFKHKFSADRIINLDFFMSIGYVVAGGFVYSLTFQFTLIKTICYAVAVVILLVFTVLRIKLAQLEQVKVAATEELTEEVVEDETVEELTEEPVELVEEPVELTEELVDESNQLNIKRTRFVNKMKFTSDKTKEYYNQIKNLLLSYGAKSKVSRRNETFRKSGLLAKISISGKSLRLHLPLDPTDEERFPLTKYHQTSLAEKKQFSEVPFTIRIKSDRALKRALELIELVCLEKPLKKKKKYEEQDFTKELEIDGEAIFEKLGILDQMTDTYSKEYYEAFKDGQSDEVLAKIMMLIPEVEKETSSEGEIQNIYIDTVLDKLSTDVISLETLKEVNIITKATNNICIKIHDSLDRPIRVECDEITPDAALAVLALNGKVILKK